MVVEEAGGLVDRRAAAWSQLARARVERTLPWLVQVLAAAGVRAVVLTGPVSRPVLLHAEQDRPVADVDLLVPPNRLRRAGAALARSGFVRVQRGVRSDTWLRRGVYVDLHVALPLVRARARRVFDLLHQRAGRVGVAGVEVVVLDEPSHLVHLALHAALDRFDPTSHAVAQWRERRAGLGAGERVRAGEIADRLGVGAIWRLAEDVFADPMRPVPDATRAQLVDRWPRPLRLRVRAIRAWARAPRASASSGVVERSVAG